ncbi:Hypothetical predicted protein [Mytilus galloprovincialis]|uniref:Uncharacterized protein n=1 Tax=Mytilus galloprovincialis TaxID=29158 RepID=A0A8B6F5H9_MYTGA|nr:Hypothetical predicted protein [Mytilus galloprovincialis]
MLGETFFSEFNTAYKVSNSTERTTESSTKYSTSITSQKGTSALPLTAAKSNSVFSTKDVEVTKKFTRVIVSNTEPTSETITRSMPEKSSSITKSLNSAESNKADKAADFTIAASATVLAVGLIIFITVVVVSIIRLSKTNNGGTKRVHRQKTHGEDRSSVSSDPSSWYNFHIKRPILRTKWTYPHQKDMHLRW